MLKFKNNSELSMTTKIFLLLLLFIHPILSKSNIDIQNQLSIRENSEIGANIGSIFKNPNKISMVDITKFELLNDNGEESLFELDKNTGNITVRSHIDRESLCANLKTDNCTRSILIDLGSTIKQIKIIIIDENDNSPVFGNDEKIISVQENIKNGTRLSLPIAHDRDIYKNGVVQYRIRQMKTVNQYHKESYIKNEQYMRVNLTKASSSVITPYLEITSQIDREQYIQFKFVLEAIDAGGKIGSCSVTVNVLDVNDNAPEWSASNYQTDIKECQSPGKIFHLTAFDKDDSNTRNGKISYRISDSTENKHLIGQIFYINDNWLYLSHNRISELIDKEKLRLFMIAEDGNGQMSECSIDITIADCNDHAPAIAISKRFAEIKENEYQTRSLATVTVTDRDRRRNGMFECHLNDTNYLNLIVKHSTPNMIVYKIESKNSTIFDREILNVYTIDIICSDQGNPSKRSRKSFSIHILDVNDNAPKFRHNMPIFHIAENNPIGGTIGKLEASDPDEQENGQIWYKIIGDNTVFTISTYGEIQSKIRFDRELEDSYTFTVMAFDKGDSPLNDSVLVKVIIEDVNDCFPIFVKDYFFEIEESYGNAITSIMLGQVNATDQDIEKNGNLNYQMVNIKPIGYINNARSVQILQRIVRVSYEGVINVYGNLDREKIPSFQITVKAYDNGQPSLSSTTEIVVKVLDVNDNIPKFIFPSKYNNHINISVNAEIGTPLATIVAKDPDYGINGSVEHSLIGRNLASDYPYDLSKNGQLIVATDLRKYQVKRRLPDRLMIKASDKGELPKSNMITLFIRYTNEKTNVPGDNPIKSNNPNSSNNGRKNIPYNDKRGNKRTRFGNDKYKNKIRKTNLSDSMILLYSLAAILFFIFVIVLSVLLYVYCSKRYVPSERYRKKICKNANSQLNIENNIKDMKPLPGTIRHSRDELCKNDDGSGVCFLGEAPSSDSGTIGGIAAANYTHLMRLNNCKYTPMLHHSGIATISTNPNQITNENQLISHSMGNPHPQMLIQQQQQQNYTTLHDPRINQIENNYQHNISINKSQTMEPKINENIKSSLSSNISINNCNKDFSSYVTSSFV